MKSRKEAASHSLLTDSAPGRGLVEPQEHTSLPAEIRNLFAELETLSSRQDEQTGYSGSNNA